MHFRKQNVQKTFLYIVSFTSQNSLISISESRKVRSDKARNFFKDSILNPDCLIPRTDLWKATNQTATISSIK